MALRCIVLGLFALLIGAPTLAASVAERSPFAQGQWWDPTRSGSGFEIFSTADVAAVIWFTHTDAGRPVWYVASGQLASLGKQPWPLLQYQWSSTGGSPVVVGSLRLDVHHPESADVVWEIAGKRGTWPIQPLIVSGVVNENDHSGVWFDPSNSGWGLSLIEQGDVLGGVLYTYDPSGAPTWVAGFDRDAKGSVEFHAYPGGACPACAWRPPVASSVGRLSFDLRSETDLGVGSTLILSMAAGVKVDRANITQLGRPASWRAADRQLASFHDASALGTYLAAGMMQLPLPSPGGSFSSPPPAATFSTTNLQESGVDEADLVKSNGVHLYTYAHDSNGRRLPVVRVARVGNEGAALDIRGSVPLASGVNTPVASAGLFLHGDNLVSVIGTQASSYIGPPWAVASSWMQGETHVEVLSTSNPDAPVTRWRAQIDGHMVSSRRIGDRLYVISRYAPYLPGFAYGATEPPAVAANQALLAGTPLSELLPKVRINGGIAAAAVPFSAVHIPPQGSRKPMADLILITAIELGALPRIAQTLAIAGSVETVYASSANLFVASSRYEARDPLGNLLPAEPSVYMTDIHQIRLGTDAMSIVGSASIEGILGYDVDKSAFRLSEHQGRLRAVTSSMAWWGNGNRNRLTILEPSTLAPGLLKTVSYLPNTRRPEPLGKPNEVLYGTRFLGDRLYAVTFKSVDPLYIVDLADGADPRITGALELPGFSDYLHPLPNGLLLGFGKDARPASVSGDGQFAWYQGLQLTLFDVANANQPRELQRVVMGRRGSESALLRSHHALSALMNGDGTGLFGLPARIHDGTPPSGSDDSYPYPWQYSGLMRFELRGTSPADARLVQLPSLITHRAAQPYPPNDDAADSRARSVLFRNGTVYVGEGRFWHQDSVGNTSGPH